MNQSQVLNIKMTPAGVNAVLNALGRMPYAEVAGLFEEIRSQAQAQFNEQTQNETPPQPLEGDTK